MAKQTLYRWRRQFGGMEVADAKRLRTLERENAALKRLVGELTLDNRMLKDVLGKIWCAWLPSAKRRRISSRRIMSASDAPAGSWRCTAVQSVGSQATWQHGHNESFNGVFRDGCLNRWLFTSVQEARRIITNWREEYNHERPHGALDGLTPHAFAVQCSSQSLGEAA